MQNKLRFIVTDVCMYTCYIIEEGNREIHNERKINLEMDMKCVMIYEVSQWICGSFFFLESNENL